MTDRNAAGCAQTGVVTEDRQNSGQFESFSLVCLRAGLRVRFQARGSSMLPTIRDGETVYIKPAAGADLQQGEIVLVKNDLGFRLHRLIDVDTKNDTFITRGDSGEHVDPAVRRDQILGIAIEKDVQVGNKSVRANFHGPLGFALRAAGQAQSVALKCCAIAAAQIRKAPSSLLAPLVILLALFAAPYSRAQVAVDTQPSTSTSAGQGQRDPSIWIK